MNKKREKRGYIIFSAIFYGIATALMIFGTFCDLKIDEALFAPGQTFARLAESYGQFVYWGMWGPALAIIFVCRRDLNGTLALLGGVSQKIKPISNCESRAYKTINIIFKALTSAGIFVLCAVGWKKLIENVIKNILINTGHGKWSQPIYLAISFAVAAVSIIIASRINRETLKKLELLAFAGVLFGAICKGVEECKTLTQRVRFREMIAWSNGFKNSDGLSEGKYSPLTREMINNTDFSAFTPWYKKGDAMEIYSRVDSFPSGHTTYSCTLFLSSLLCRSFEKLKKFAVSALFVSTAYTAAMGYTRLAAGAHYLTDVAAAAIIGYTAFVTVRFIYIIVISRSEKLQVFRPCPAEVSCRPHSPRCGTDNSLRSLYRPRFPWLTTNLANRHFRIFRFWL